MAAGKDSRSYISLPQPSEMQVNLIIIIMYKALKVTKLCCHA